MTIWSSWLEAIQNTLEFLSADLGLGLGLAIVVGTLLMRLVLLSIAGPIAYRAGIKQEKLTVLQPELQRLKDQYATKPDIYMQKLMELYRKNGISMVDGKGFFGTTLQIPIFLGMYQVLRQMGESIRFLWVPNLLKPDTWLAVIAGVTTAIMMAVNPNLPEHMRDILIIVPAFIAIVVALKFSSALAVYWATTNLFSAAQTFMLHRLVRHRIQSGAIKL